MTTQTRRAERVLTQAGLRGALLVRDVESGHEVGLAPDQPFPLASLVKLPLAGAVLDACTRGRVDLDAPVTLGDSERSSGGPGLARYTRPATIAVGDLITLALEISDNTAADALFRLVPPEEVTAWVAGLGIRDLLVRHPIEALYSSLALRVDDHDFPTVMGMLATAEQQRTTPPLPELDLERANTGTARSLADLLHRIWDGSLDPRVSEPLRRALAGNVFRHRLAPDFASDTSVWSSKTGSFLHLRHEAGVVEHLGRGAVMVVALTASEIPAIDQPLAEQAIGEAARLLHDELLRVA
jgi:beta-lactamase class A